MVVTDAIQPPRSQHQPASLTLADLSMLVIGFALAFYLPQLHHLDDRITSGNSLMPGWVVCLFVIREAAMKGGLVLAPVILARRTRYGSLPRPADWLAILIVLPLLYEVIHVSDWIKRFARWYLVDLRTSLGYPIPSLLHANHPGSAIMFGDTGYFGYEGFPIDFTPGQEDRVWGWVATILLVAILVVLGLGWKRMPDWAKTALIWLAALTWLAGVSSLLFACLGQVSQAIAGWVDLPPSIILQIVLGLGRLPEYLLFGIPVVAVIFDVRRGAVRNWTWTEWLGAITATIALTIGVVIHWYADLINTRDPIALKRLGMQALLLIAVSLISWMIVKHFSKGGTESADP